VSDVVARQRWPWSRLVDIDYTLNCGDPNVETDVTLTAYNGSQTLGIPIESLSGDLFNVKEGARRIVWDPTKTDYTNGILMNFSVALAATPVPFYMVVDLTKSAGEEGQVAYVYESDLAAGTYGPAVTNPVAGIQSLIWTGVTNDVYKTDKLVLRRIPAGTFTMSGKSVRLTRDFYIGVFEVTQGQWKTITGGWGPSSFMDPVSRAARPVERITYHDLRGATNDAFSVNWPATGHAVAPSGFLGGLRHKTGITAFDLPTDAQWEYACRAGTTTIFNDGDPAATVAGEHNYTNVWLNALGRYKWNGGLIGGTVWPGNYVSPENGTATVGSYAPNAWGLYDMHGNVYEWCLDWHDTALTGGDDPVGTAGGTQRIRRGGSWAHDPYNLQSGMRLGIDPGGQLNNWMGFRVALFLP
jgi:formylglycine-generating enzyme required for sulfatase activity